MSILIITSWGSCEDELRYCMESTWLVVNIKGHPLLLLLFSFIVKEKTFEQLAWDF